MLQSIWHSIIALFIAIFTLPLAAQTHTDNKSQDRLDNTLLWKLSGKGIKTSYLYGTIHLIPENDFFLNKASLSAFNKTKQLVMEMDMSNQMMMALEMMTLSPMKDNKTLRDILSEEDFALVQHYFEKEATSLEIKALPFKMINTWKPMISQTLLYQEMIKGKTKSYEMELLEMAKKQKMTLGGLETVADQMGVFDMISYEDQAAALVATIKSLQNKEDNSSTEFEQIVNLYKAQDIEGMIEASKDEFAKADNMEDELLIKRNKNWIPLIPKFAKEKSTFFAVGAAHLGGPYGIIRLLRQAGYKVEPILNK